MNPGSTSTPPSRSSRSKDFTPAVEPFSIDEAFLDLSGTAYGASRSAAAQAGRTVQRWVAERLGLSASVGIGPNKLIAKMAAGVVKPHGLTWLDEDAFRRRWWPLPVGALWGIGEQTDLESLAEEIAAERFNPAARPAIDL